MGASGEVGEGRERAADSIPGERCLKEDGTPQACGGAAGGATKKQRGDVKRHRMISK